MSILLVLTGFIIAFITVLYYEQKIRQMRRTEQKNKVHFYVARDNGGDLWLYFGKPIRLDDEFISRYAEGIVALGQDDYFKSFGLNPRDYDYLKWEDEPVEVFLNLED